MQDSDGNFYLIVPRGGGVMVSLWLEPIPNDGDDDGNDHTTVQDSSWNPAIEGAFMISGESAITSMTSGNPILLSPATLLSFKATGITNLIISTPIGVFTIPIDDLIALIGNGNMLRFALNENTLEIYVDDSTVPVKAISI
jgi:hypothetical protein